MAISVVINTYNAEKTLSECLEALKGFDEIVVCDMESADSTREIAAKYGARIVIFPKGNCKSAEPARTFAIQSATSEWVLVVDADEIVTPQLKEYLYSEINQPNCPAGLFIPRKNFLLNYRMRCRYPDYQLRFFKREGTVWPPFVHTRPIVNGKVEKIPSSEIKLALVHKSDTISGFISKMNKYTDNEVEKRKNEKINFLKLFYAPIFRFFKVYILKGGFLDGKYGVIYAMQEAYYKSVVLSKIIEARQNAASIHQNNNEIC